MEREQEHRHSERKRVAVYARVSTGDQSCEAQLHDLREYPAVFAAAIFASMSPQSAAVVMFPQLTECEEGD